MNNEKCQSCGSCGFPMKKPEDFSLGNIASRFCQYCTDAQGELLDYDTILNLNTKYYISSQGIAEEAAMQMAKDLLATMPAWKK